MKPEVTADGDLTIVKLHGKIDAVTSPKLQESVEALIDDGADRILFDLSEVLFVASAGLRVFAVVAKRLKSIENVALAGMSSNVREVFQLVGFDRLMTLSDDVDAAKQALAVKG